jgi:hypothetical protein
MIWYKPLDWIKIDAGRFRVADLRGKVGNNSWFGDNTISRADEDAIFQRFDGSAAVMLEVKPEAVSGLSVYAHVNGMENTYAKLDSTNNTMVAVRSAGYVWENTQFAVGYELPNIGLVRAQFVGAHPALSMGASPTINNSRIELAFAYTGLAGLTLDVGGGFFLPFEDAKNAPPIYSTPASPLQEGKFSPGFKAGLGVKYVADPLTVNLLLGGTFAQAYEDEPAPGYDIKGTFGFRLKPYLTVAYKLNDTFTAQLEGGVDYAGDTKVTMGEDKYTIDGGMNYGFGLGLQTTFAPGCTIRAGLTYAGGEAPGALPFRADTEAKALTGAFQIPIVFAVAF